MSVKIGIYRNNLETMRILKDTMRVTDLVIDEYLDLGYEIEYYHHNKKGVRIWVLTSKKP